MAISTKTQTNKYLDIFRSIDFDKIIDHPNILIAANFWDQERFHAAKTCYKFMRSIDDLIDNRKSQPQSILAHEKEQFESIVNSWINTIPAASQNNTTEIDLVEIVNKFHIPSWPLEAFAKSMIYDIHNDGFPTLNAFLDYAKGASVAPAAIFVHLCGLTIKDDQYVPPIFDVKKAAIPCAIFSYLVHIIRDFQKDHISNLNYFPDDLMDKNGLDRQKLLQMAQGEPVSKGFRNMIHELYVVADFYRLKTYEKIQEIKPLLDPQSQLSLEIIFQLYLMVFERIDVNNGSFTAIELNPTPQEIKDRVLTTISGFIVTD